MNIRGGCFWLCTGICRFLCFSGAAVIVVFLFKLLRAQTDMTAHFLDADDILGLTKLRLLVAHIEKSGFIDKAGETLSAESFVGFKWFTQLFQNSATKKDILRVIKNTLAMSGMGILTSWVPMMFAVFLSEIKNNRFRRFVQTFTTIPNFISWVLVYAIALAIFSTDGFVNTMLTSLGNPSDTNYLMSSSHMWLKMLAWGLWKSLGWNAIIYMAAISGIDQGLYEAATVDGAGRFAKMWYITISELIPTYMVLLLMSVANILTNGMDKYLVFSNPVNKNAIEVLDLYVYNLGIGNGLIPLSTVIGMVKSVISVILLLPQTVFPSLSAAKA